LTNILLHNYYYRYSQYRKNVKQDVDSANYAAAKTQLDNIITEHETKFPDTETRKDFSFGERNILIRARNHIQQIVIEHGNPNYYDVDYDESNNYTVTIKPHSEKVKEILNSVPKTNYS